jgi:hypothetical protein
MPVNYNIYIYIYSVDSIGPNWDGFLRFPLKPKLTTCEAATMNLTAIIDDGPKY